MIQFLIFLQQTAYRYPCSRNSQRALFTVNSYMRRQVLTLLMRNEFAFYTLQTQWLSTKSRDVLLELILSLIKSPAY